MNQFGYPQKPRRNQNLQQILNAAIVGAFLLGVMLTANGLSAKEGGGPVPKVKMATMDLG